MVVCERMQASLELTTAQRERYIQILDEYCEQMAKLRAHRERALQMLREMCGPGPVSGCGGRHLPWSLLVGSLRVVRAVPQVWPS